MPPSISRHQLLHARLARLAPLLRRLERGDPASNPPLRLALWRLRELLPVLQLDSAMSRKLGTRLRHLTRRLGKARELDAQLALVDDLCESERRLRQAATRVRNDVRRRTAELGADALRRKAAADVRRALRKLASIEQSLRRSGDTLAAIRAIGWAVKARVARRAATLKQALDDAGSVYAPRRLRGVRAASKKLHLGGELMADLVGPLVALDLRPFEQVQDPLDRLRDAERLIGRIRRVQDALAPSDLKGWQELDEMIGALENLCRRLHARHVRQRPELASLCDRLRTRAVAPHVPRRKAS